MTPPAPHRLPAPLEAAIRRLKLASRGAAARAVDALGLAALAAGNALERDQLLEAQFELNRKSALYALTFDDAYDERVRRDSPPARDDAAPDAASRWDALSLVEDRELELQVAADRFGLELAHACEWELRELGAYMGALLPGRPDAAERHPLRPEIAGHAMLRAIEVVSDRPPVRKRLQAELTRALADGLRAAYAEVVGELRAGGVQPAGLNVRGAELRRGAGGGPRTPATSRGDLPAAADAGRPPARAGERRGGGGGTTPMGQIDRQLMSLLRRLADAPAEAPAGPAAGLPRPAGDATATGAENDRDDRDGDAAAGALPQNLIHAHRDELRRAAHGGTDHLVIDVVGSLFDAILADPKVPPQIAREIARLQLPVLRAALGDPSFFASRRHPVRRFVNRIASLGAACDDFADSDAQQLLALVRSLVQEIVAGDFEQIELYEHKLALLESFVGEQARRSVQTGGVDPLALLAAKDAEPRLQQHYAGWLRQALQPLAAPEFLRDFLADVWSAVLLAAARRDGAHSERVQRMRDVARELFMSVQPKGAPGQRKAFVAQLPQLMRELGAGLDLIGWPEASRKAFFGLLLPAHADALKGAALRTLEYNLLARQVEEVLHQPLPSAAELPPADPGAAPASDTAAAEPRLSAEEAAQVGLVDESAVDWDGVVDIDLGAEPPAAEPGLPGLPAADAPEPAAGAELADHLQVGYAYRMQLDDSWQKVRLAHVSPGRAFYVFTHGERQRGTVSLTARMLRRMCEAGRLRAFENAYLMDRATARARRQLAAIGAAPG